jgi:predicted nuclease of predicted toxin-antitoxin system
MLRFHLDENVDHAVAVGLRGRGIDVTTTPEASLKGASDAEQLAYCAREHRVILTHDDDLLALSAQGVSHRGITFCKSATRSIGQIVMKLASLSRKHIPEEFVNRVEFL